jgi:hypothetical protein
VFFDNGSESNENFFDIRFVFEWVKPDIFSEMINKYYIMFKAIMRENWRGPHIREYNFKRFGGDNCRVGEGQPVAFIAKTRIT